MSHLMLDLETLDVEESAVVLSIGAVVFDPEFGLGENFHYRLKVDPQLRMKRTISEDTLTFWLSLPQGLAAEQLANMPAIHPSVVGRAFQDLVDMHDCKYIWGNDEILDIGILKSLFYNFAVEWPFDYWSNRCFRTVRKGFPVPVRSEPTVNGVDFILHSALDDAIGQAEYLLAVSSQFGYELESE